MRNEKQRVERQEQESSYLRQLVQSMEKQFQDEIQRR